MPKTSTQTRLTSHLLELSSQLGSITINDLRRSIKPIDRPHSTLIQPIFTSIVLRDCGEGQFSFNVDSLIILLTSSFFSYCEVVDIDPYYTLKKFVKPDKILTAKVRQASALPSCEKSLRVLRREGKSGLSSRDDPESFSPLNMD